MSSTPDLILRANGQIFPSPRDQFGLRGNRLFCHLLVSTLSRSIMFQTGTRLSPEQRRISAPPSHFWKQLFLCVDSSCFFMRNGKGNSATGKLHDSVHVAVWEWIPMPPSAHSPVTQKIISLTCEFLTIVFIRTQIQFI